MCLASIGASSCTSSHAVDCGEVIVLSTGDPCGGICGLRPRTDVIRSRSGNVLLKFIIVIFRNCSDLMALQSHQGNEFFGKIALIEV